MSFLTYRLGNGVFGTLDPNDPTGSIQISTVSQTVMYAYDGNGNVQYQGFAVPGSLTSAAVWAIKKYTYTSISSSYVIASETWSGGSGAATNIWDNRASLSYS